MKILKSYKIFESNNFNSMTDKELEEKLHWLRIEHADIQREISQIVNIQKHRKESSEEELTKDWPKSIWDLDKFQIDWVLEHGHHTTSKHYEISNKYLGQLEGVMDSGFNRETNQYIFNISTSYWLTGDSYVSNDDGIKSINFLHKNLKKIKFDGQEATMFNILFNNSDDYDYSLFYYDDDKVVIKKDTWYQTEYKSIEEAIKALAQKDIEDNLY